MIMILTLFKVVGIDVNSDEAIKNKKINSGYFLETNDETLKNELKKSVLRGNLLASTDKNYFSNTNTILVSINCDLIKKTVRKKST